MLCKAESRDPAHCLSEGRKVTRCAADLCVIPNEQQARMSTEESVLIGSAN